LMKLWQMVIATVLLTALSLAQIILCDEIVTNDRRNCLMNLQVRIPQGFKWKTLLRKWILCMFIVKENVSSRLPRLSFKCQNFDYSFTVFISTYYIDVWHRLGRFLKIHGPNLGTFLKKLNKYVRKVLGSWINRTLANDSGSGLLFIFTYNIDPPNHLQNFGQVEGGEGVEAVPLAEVVSLALVPVGLRRTFVLGAILYISYGRNLQSKLT
jgi:hypothetical protein